MQGNNERAHTDLIIGRTKAKAEVRKRPRKVVIEVWRKEHLRTTTITNDNNDCEDSDNNSNKLEKLKISQKLYYF